MHEPPDLLSTILIFLLSMPAFLCWEKNQYEAPLQQNRASPLRETLQDFSCKIHQQLVLGARQALSYPKSFCKFLSTVTDCSCMDLPMPHPAVTCSNRVLSEIYLFSPIRGYKQCKNTAEKLCKAAKAVLSPGCCSSGWSQCAHTFWAAVTPVLPGAQPASHMDMGFGFSIRRHWDGAAPQLNFYTGTGATPWLLRYNMR